MKMKCQFCNKGEAEIPIYDGETQQEILICKECDELQYFKIPKKVKKMKGYKEFTIQELEKKIDELIDNQIDELKLQRQGIEI
ncbi:MAG TPA: hypothetical protein VMZ91_00105 [Candidatus Paceibacterota bacterium]|nr:hypothetical protein [Candidatus Paceibacterota bacterium]